MSYRVDQTKGDIIIDGFQNGIGASPYVGFTDMKSVNISGVPNEASVNFSTQSVTAPIVSNVSVTSADATNDFVTCTSVANLENGMAITFSATTIGGLTTNTVYWITNLNIFGANTFVPSNKFNGSTVNITSDGTGTFSTINMGLPKFFANAKDSSGTATRYMLDGNGRVWTNQQTTTSGYWKYAGNSTLTNANGNGLVYYEVTNGTTTKGFLFVFRLGLIDYVETTEALSAMTWTYGWNPATGTTGNTSPTIDISSIFHTAIVPPDNRVYFCNGSNIGKFFQTASATLFDPTNTATYTYTSYPLLPINDKAQCIAPLDVNLLIGGIGNVVYVWDTTSSLISYPIQLPESNTQTMITVNTNTFIFCGNRGNIYITNGSQASFFNKVPDHLSGVPEPYFLWGGATHQKNRLYFGVQCLNNAGTYLGNYAGVWCIDLVSNAIYLSNQASFGSYGTTNGEYVSAVLALPSVTYSNQPTGIGLFIGWFDGTKYGIDKSISTPYTGGQSYIISDMIPIGTALNPVTGGQLEVRMSTPLLTGESIELQVGNTVNGTFTSAGTISGDGNILVGNIPSFPIQQQQWILIKAILTAKASSPSYNRITELRIIGMTAAGSQVPFETQS